MAPRSFSELLAKLRSQVGFLRRSSEHFDDGDREEGERLALAARILLHDTPQSHSLLGQMKVKKALGFTDTSIRTDDKTTSHGGSLYSQTRTVHAGLVSLQTTVDGAWTYGPILAPEGPERINPPARFEPWWTRPFLTDTAGESVTRRSLVLAVANKDGGAHVARAIPEALNLLGSGASMRFSTESGQTSSPIPGVVMATMRQVAYELLDTLERELPNFIGAESGPEAEFTDAERAAVRRNELCPCGSGRKSKVCHGA